MSRQDLGELILLAAIWGASFLFIRMGAADFGPLPLAWVRVAGATAVLLPVLAWRGETGALLKHWKPIFIVGLTNSALPFALFAYAMLSITASLASIFNAATPLFGGLLAWVWLRDRLSPSRMLGLAIGFIGVFGLAWNKAGLKGGADGADTTLAVLACLLAAFSYGLSASFTKRYTSGVPPMALAAGSQVSATIALAMPAWWTWPAANPGAGAWTHALLLAVLCTGLAYILFFRLIAHAGAANALTVTFLIPAFAVAWGAMFLGEVPTVAMLIGCVVILVGTALATGLLPRARRVASAA